MVVVLIAAVLWLWLSGDEPQAAPPATATPQQPPAGETVYLPGGGELPQGTHFTLDNVSVRPRAAFTAGPPAVSAPASVHRGGRLVPLPPSYHQGAPKGTW